MDHPKLPEKLPSLHGGASSHNKGESPQELQKHLYGFDREESAASSKQLNLKHPPIAGLPTNEKRKSSSSSMTEERRERKRRSNRLCAQRKRIQEKQLMDSLSAQHVELVKANRVLKEESAQLHQLLSTVGALLQQRRASSSVAGNSTSMAASQVTILLASLKRQLHALLAPTPAATPAGSNDPGPTTPRYADGIACFQAQLEQGTTNSSSTVQALVKIVQDMNNSESVRSKALNALLAQQQQQQQQQPQVGLPEIHWAKAPPPSNSTSEALQLLSLLVAQQQQQQQDVPKSFLVQATEAHQILSLLQNVQGNNSHQHQQGSASTQVIPAPLQHQHQQQQRANSGGISALQGQLLLQNLQRQQEKQQQKQRMFQRDEQLLVKLFALQGERSAAAAAASNHCRSTTLPLQGSRNSNNNKVELLRLLSELEAQKRS